MSATSEMSCVVFSDYRAAVAELDKPEIWSLSVGSALTSLASKQCLAVPSGAVAGARVEVMCFECRVMQSGQVDRRVCHGHQCPQDDNGSTDGSFCAWCETSYEESSCN